MDSQPQPTPHTLMIMVTRVNTHYNPCLRKSTHTILHTVLSVFSVILQSGLHATPLHNVMFKFTRMCHMQQMNWIPDNKNL